MSTAAATRPDARPAGSAALRAGSALMVLGAAAFIGYAVLFFIRNFTDSFLELGISAAQVDVGRDAIRQFSPSLYNYVSHLHIAATGLAVVFLSWFGVRRGRVGVDRRGRGAGSRPRRRAAAHYPYGLASIGHLGLIYLATAVFVVGAVLAGKALLDARSG